ncbi:MAG TPA: hypothetical protein PL182_06415 [Pseudobdellovibrionaceae bacterium]|nr:hypothetical protein [Pseudobdellovibrionaceae bacterium]
MKDTDKVVKQVNKDLTTSIQRSDIGKVIGGAVGNATRAGTDGTIDLFTGNSKRGVSKILGSGMYMMSDSPLVESSSSYKNFLQTKTGNDLYLGLGRDMVRAAQGHKTLMNQGAIDKEGLTAYTSYTGKRAAYVGAAVAGGAAFGGGGAAAGGGGAAAVGTAGAGTGIGGTLAAAVLPEIGNVIKDGIKSQLRGPTESMGSQTAGTAAGSPNFILIALTVLFFILLIPALAKRRRK